MVTMMTTMIVRFQQRGNEFIKTNIMMWHTQNVSIASYKNQPKGHVDLETCEKNIENTNKTRKYKQNIKYIKQKHKTKQNKTAYCNVFRDNYNWHTLDSSIQQTAGEGVNAASDRWCSAFWFAIPLRQPIDRAYWQRWRWQNSLCQWRNRSQLLVFVMPAKLPDCQFYFGTTDIACKRLVAKARYLGKAALPLARRHAPPDSFFFFQSNKWYFRFTGK